LKRYRIMQVVYASLLIGLALVIVYLLFYPYERISGTLPLNDPNSVLEMVLSAINNHQLPLSGKGTATMRMENNIEDPDKLFSDKELTVNFEFKGQSSRTDIFESNVDTKDSRLRTFVVTDKQTLVFTPIYQSAWIEGYQEHEKIGFDFHPDVFMNFLSSPLAKLLKGLMKHPPDYASTEVDTEGILCYIAGGHLVQQDGEGFDEEIKLSFDTRKELLPVSYYMEDKYVDPNKDWGREAKFEWAKFDSAWYPTQAEYFVQPGKRKHVVLTVKNFNPNVDVPDDDFTLDDMGIPDGILVSDSIAHKVSPYGTSPNLP
jgi:hypothetical protein